MKKTSSKKIRDLKRVGPATAPICVRERVCSEGEIGPWLEAWILDLRPTDLILLEGDLGAGKSTFARILLSLLGVKSAPEGSPTFALMHEYHSARFPEIAHIDLYRIESVQELEDSGIEAALWEREALVLLEWAERFPDLWRRRSLGRQWKVRLDFVPQNIEQRRIQISELPVEALS